MVGTSKILTVSYGTFSCTLEGFDDSFNTMKAIAEYFRDLAADDRYFGAEPSAPDAEMLARIAERETSRRVDAKLQEGGVLLRAAALNEADITAPVDGDALEHDAETLVKVEADRKEAEAQKAAEKEAREQAEEKAKAEAQAKAEAEAKAKAEEQAKAEAEAKEKAEAQAKAEAEAKAKAEEQAKAEAEAKAKAEEQAKREAKATAQKKSENDDSSSDVDPSSSVSAAPAAQTEESTETDVEETRDDLSSPMLATKEAVPAHPDAESVAAKLQRIRAVAGPTDDDTSNDATEAFLPESDGLDVADMTDEASESENDSASNVEEPRSHVIHLSRDSADSKTQESEAQESANTNTGNGINLGLLDGADDLDDYHEDSDFSDEDLGVDLDLIEEVIANDATKDEPAEATKNSFAAKPLQVEDEALDRLMSETDAKLREPASSRRRDAIAQLKAAVAAKEAARQVGEREVDDTGIENAFRNDLSEAVEPEEMANTAPLMIGSDRPRVAPLKLVAAQRVDLKEDDSDAASVTPRRVKSTQQEAPVAAGSFAEFAENMGATELPDLLEAAAAYTAFVEGAGEFSRPQILRRVRAISDTDFKREDGLRTFADLLNSGRFTQVRNGRFQVSNDSRFNPESQAG